MVYNESSDVIQEVSNLQQLTMKEPFSRSIAFEVAENDVVTFYIVTVYEIENW